MGLGLRVVLPGGADDILQGLRAAHAAGGRQPAQGFSVFACGRNPNPRICTTASRDVNTGGLDLTDSK